MRADKLYEAVLALLGEETYSCEDYRHLRFRIINKALSSLLSTYNTKLLSEGKKTLDRFPVIAGDGNEIPIDDNFALEVLCPMVASLLVSDHDRDKANVLMGMADASLKKYSKVNFKSIINSY